MVNYLSNEILDNLFHIENGMDLNSIFQILLNQIQENLNLISILIHFVKMIKFGIFI
ncbi:hypothetical protein LCGC14_1576330 [marine sediment metagenome]|uniref:Uncharacterized protein n=1 Tax=marine sediment metagenome TaxID=412755 RepID=A0A0F9IIB5_9ZZZZ